ncbi:MAG: hypothetical protein RLZZ04_498 [Cyanobacteriota bacterium]|jgi:hypothetical protein
MESISINNPESLSPKSKSNPIQGILVNLLYLEDGNNFAAVVIKEEDSDKLFTLTAESDLMNEANAIQVNNLEGFQSRLQDAFYHDSLVSIYYENNRIDSLVIIKQAQNIKRDPLVQVGASTKCHLSPNRCK